MPGQFLDLSWFRCRSFLGLRHLLVGAVEIVLVIVSANIAASVFWTMFAGPSVAMVDPNLIRAKERQTNSLSQYSILTEYDAFYPEKVIQAELAAPPSPESALHVKLFGTRLTDGGGYGSAIMRLPDYNHSVVEVGDEISPGVDLVEIHERHVVVAYEGRRQTISLDVDGRQLLEPIDAHNAQGNRSTTSFAVTRSQLTPTGTPFGVFSEEIDAKGQVTGFRVDADEMSGAPLQGDLQTGDLILAVNGISATDLGPASKMWQLLQSADDVRVLVERGGERLTVDLSAP